MMTTIQLDEKLKKKLDLLKIHSRETYNELLKRILEGNSFVNPSRESLVETLEVLSDPETMRNLAESLEEINKGNYGISLDELEKELGL